jgi:hypothetical protein
MESFFFFFEFFMVCCQCLLDPQRLSGLFDLVVIEHSTLEVEGLTLVDRMIDP